MKTNAFLLSSLVGLSCLCGIGFSGTTVSVQGTAMEKTIAGEENVGTNDIANVTITTMPKTDYKMGDVFDASALKAKLVYSIDGVKKTKDASADDFTWTHNGEKLGVYVNQIVFTMKDNKEVSFSIPITVKADAGLILEIGNDLKQKYLTELDTLDFTQATVYSRGTDGTVEKVNNSDCKFFDGDTEITSDNLSSLKLSVGKHSFKVKKGTEEGIKEITVVDSNTVVYPYHIQAENCEGHQDTDKPTTSWWNVPENGGDSNTCYTNNDIPSAPEGFNIKLEDQPVKIAMKVPAAGDYDLVARCWCRGHILANQIQVSVNSDSSYSQVNSDDNLLPANQTDHISRGVGNLSWFYGRFGTYTLKKGDNYLYFKGPGWDDKRRLEIDYFMVQPKDTITDNIQPTVINLREGLSKDAAGKDVVDDIHSHMEMTDDKVIYLKQNTHLNDIIDWMDENGGTDIRPQDHLFCELSMRIGGMMAKEDLDGEKYWQWGAFAKKAFITEIPIYENNITGLDVTKLGYQYCTAKAYSLADGNSYSASFLVCVIK